MNDVHPSESGGSTSAPPAADSGDAPARERRVVLFAIVAVLVLALDIVSKVVVVASLGGAHAPVRILGGAIYLDVTRNSGAAFSLGAGDGLTIVFTLVALIVAVIIARAARRLRSIGWAIALALILAGALGNLTDRIFRAPGIGRGHVVDWISLFGPYGAHWPIFNLADAAVCCGAVLAALLAVLGVELSGARAASRRG